MGEPEVGNLYQEEKRRISHARPKKALSHRARHEEDKAGGRNLVFISPEPVAMNNMLPRWGGEAKIIIHRYE
ncbi:hypothetical protein [Desulfonatronovibrio hydrogenovorans]|uniref:hypothetical protein n=1 Tax=Desulfonatronovibrio hydrogenovorans TaxID=53245 RepID=UPI000490667E|nr:hypothetical protein [Desulfonatronovibrio hydrogenovorans]